MGTFKKKTYENSYLYNANVDDHNKVLYDFIINSNRIDKKSNEFRGIIEDVKRYQRSSILYTVLTSPNVILCISNSKELSRAFKVFEAKDVNNNREPRVFIDVTNLIQFKNGSYVCNNRDYSILVTYLFNALGYLLYSKEPIKLISNSNIVLSGTECFVSLFNYIPDYLRIIGYSQNKEKISYLAGLYFIYNLMGKELDMSSKNAAAKVAGVNTSDIRSFELYYDAEKDFKNIDTFITLIANTFKLKGFTTETFIGKWNYSFGTGTYFATELLTSFMSLMTSAYTGAYVVNQKQIERCCGASMVKFCEVLMQIGSDSFDRRGYMNETELDQTIYRDKSTVALKEFLFNKNKLPDDAKYNKECYISKAKAVETTKKMIEFYTSVGQRDKISGTIKNFLIEFSAGCIDYSEGRVEIEISTLSAVTKLGTKYFNDKDRRSLTNELKSFATLFKRNTDKFIDTDKAIANKYSKCLVEVNKALNLL